MEKSLNTKQQGSGRMEYNKPLCLKTNSGEYTESQLKDMDDNELFKLVGEVKENIRGIREQLDERGISADADWKKRAKGALWINEKFLEIMPKFMEDIAPYFMDAAKDILSEGDYLEIMEEAENTKEQLQGTQVSLKKGE